MKTALTQDSKPEFIGQIVDLFEDYLDGKEITIINEERDEAIASGDMEPEEAAVIYGEHYDMIGDVISKEVEIYGLMDKPFENTTVRDAVVENIMNAFYEVLEKGKCKKPVPEPDILSLEASIRDTFEKWGVASGN